MFSKIKIPTEINIREYQKEAIKSWLSNKGCGILEMATGSGKTITSLCAMTKLITQYKKAGLVCGLIVVLPYKVLLEQWGDDFSWFGVEPLACYESKNTWLPKLKKQIELFNKNKYSDFVVTVTNTTFSSDDFQEQLNLIESDYILCIDELHHFATEKGISLLPNSATFRLGLSATLMTKWENVYMDRLKSYFGKGVVYHFSLADAIEHGFLTPYKYHPIFVELSDEEKSEYYLLSKKIGRIYAQNYEDSDEILQSLLIKRARIIATAENKLKRLIEMKDTVQGTKYNLFYCGDKIFDNERYVDKVNKIVSFTFNMHSHTFTASENKSERKRILKDFTKGNIDALTAIRCLDEGVDIPALKRAFILSSSTNPKEFIQRRGRILRKHPGKDLAEIYDFFVVPTLDRNEIKKMPDDQLLAEKRILNREFDRFKEFADLANNKHQAYNAIIKVWDLYNR